MSAVITIALWVFVGPVVLLALRVLSGPRLGPWAKRIAVALATVLALSVLAPIWENRWLVLPAILILMTLPTFWLLYKAVQRENMSEWAHRDPPPDAL